MSCMCSRLILSTRSFGDDTRGTDACEMKPLPRPSLHVSRPSQTSNWSGQRSGRPDPHWGLPNSRSGWPSQHLSQYPKAPTTFSLAQASAPAWEIRHGIIEEGTWRFGDVALDRRTPDGGLTYTRSGMFWSDARRGSTTLNQHIYRSKFDFD